MRRWQGMGREVRRESKARARRDYFLSANKGLLSYFVSYELIKKALTPAGSTELSLPAVVTAGGFAGVAMWSLAIPPDVSASGPRTPRDRLLTLCLFADHQISPTIRSPRHLHWFL